MRNLESNLLPCPFCGAKARLIKCYDKNYEKVTGWDVGCNGVESDCIALDGFEMFQSSTEINDAIKKWNTRADGQNERKKFYVIYESYTDLTQFEGVWTVILKEFDSLEDAQNWIENSEDWKESKEYERTCLGPLVLVENLKK